MKLIYLDTETSGLNYRENDILTIGGIIEIDDEIKEEFYLEIQPFNYNNISKEALEVNGLTLEQIKTFLSTQDAYKKLISIFSKYINKFDKKDKFVMIGHNAKFDIDFLNEFFLKNGDKYFGSWIDYHCICTVVMLNLMKYKKAIEIENCKLITASKKFNIPLEAHNAMSDIKATRQLFKILIDKIEIKQ